MKQSIEVFDYANEITGALKKGVLLTTKNGEKINSMTIGWGMLGRVWEKPYFIVFVREGRYTRELLDSSGNFTVNIPYGSYDKKVIGYCGSKSGRDTDKIEDLGLTLIEPEVINTPAIKELPLTLECKVAYQQLQNKDAIPPEIREKMYPASVDSSNPMANRDYHVVYYGEIVSAYILGE